MKQFSKSVILFVMFLVLACNSLLRAQQESPRTSGSSIQESQAQKNWGSQSLLSTGVILDSPLNPETYRLGPNDIFTIDFGIRSMNAMSIPINPEGWLVIPTVGEINLKNQTLAMGREIITKLVQQKYPQSAISVVFSAPRRVLVQVNGNVVNPGMYVVSATDRANRAIEFANAPMITEIELRTQPNRRDIIANTLTRSIRIRRNGSILNVDLLKYALYKDDSFNPYLEEGDVIVVPEISEASQFVGIYGAIKSPGRYEFVEGDRIHDLLNFGTEFFDSARKDSLLLFRLTMDGIPSLFKVFSLDTSNISLFDMKLEPGDRIIVLHKESQRDEFVVSIRGNIRFPGRYPVSASGTKLTEIVTLAGGGLPNAALESIEIRRTDARLQAFSEEYKHAFLLRAGVPLRDLDEYAKEVTVRSQNLILRVDLNKIVSGELDDITILPNDDIFVGSYIQSIIVLGQVKNPGAFNFVKGQNAEHYIKLAGGFSERARTNDIYIIKGTTRQWFKVGDTSIEDGDEIWVPRALDRYFEDYLGLTAQIASVFGVILSILVLITR